MAVVIGELYVNIMPDAKGLDKGIEKAKKDTQDLAKYIDSISNKLTAFGKSMTTKVSLPLSAFGALAVKSAAEAEGAISKFNVVFRGLENEMQDWVTTFRNNFPLARGEIIKMSADLQDLLVPMGVNRSKAADMTKEWFHLAGALSAFNDVPIEDALNAIRSGIAGQTEPLRRFGVDATVTAIKQEALAMKLIATGQEMDAQTKQLALLSLAYKQSADAVNGLEEQKGSLLWQTQELKADIKDLAVEFGQMLIPEVKEAVKWVSDGVKWFASLDEKTKQNIIGLAKLLIAIGPVSLALGKLGQGISGAIKLSKNLSDTTTLLGKGFSFLAASPVGMLITAVAALTFAFVKLRRAEKEAHEQAVNDQIEIIKKQIEGEYDAQIQALEDKKKIILEGVQAKKDGVFTEKQALIDALDDERREIERRYEYERQQIQDTIRNLEDSYQDRVDAINDEYGTYERKTESKIDLERRLAREAIDGLEEIKRAAQEQHDERIRQLEEQALAQLSAEERAAIEALQSQIDAIDAQTEAEEEALRLQEYQERLAEYDRRIAAEQDAERRVELEQEKQKLIEDEQRRSLLKQRDAEKERIRQSIEDVKREFEQKREDIKNGLNQELEDQKAIEAEKLQNTITTIDNAIAERERERDEAIRILEEERDEKLRIAEEEFNNAVEYNNKRLEDLQIKQENEITEYEKTRDAAIAAFDATGFAFTEMQNGMQTETQESIDKINEQIAALEDLKQTALEAESIAKEAKKQVQELADLQKEVQQANLDYWTQQGTQEGDIAPPVFHDGGIFNAPMGSHEGLALLQDGEMILTQEQQSQVFGNSGSSAGNGITNNFNIANLNVRDESDINKIAFRVNSLEYSDIRDGE